MSVKRRVFSALDGLIKCDRAIVFLWYLVLLLCIVEATKPAGICAMNGCSCVVQAHRWVMIKCAFSKEQVNART